MEHVIAPDDRYLPPPVDCHVKAGEQVEVDDDTAASLREQGWKTARQVAAEKREARKAREAAAEERVSGEAGPLPEVDEGAYPPGASPLEVETEPASPAEEE